MFKIKNHLAPLKMQELFSEQQNAYYFRKEKHWEGNNVRTVLYGTETFSHIGPKTWDLLPPYLRDCTTLNDFKQKIKHWKPEGCSCRLCKTFIPNLGFID